MSAINEQFYGTKANWININNARYELFKPAWTEGSYNTTRYGSLDTLVRSSTYNPENQATVPLDSSIVPWKVHKNSKICSRHYCEVSFPNHVAGDASATDYFGQHASYKESDKSALKEVNGGYRFFLASQEALDNSSAYGQGAWNCRYSPYNYKGEFLNGTSGTALYTSCYPIIGFNYKKTIMTCVVRLVPKQYIDSPADPTSADGNENHYYSNGNTGPDYGGSVIDLGALTAQHLVDNYVVGFSFCIYSGGAPGSGSSPAGVSIGLFPFDPMNPTPTSEWGVDFGSYYPYQQPYCAYTEWLASAASRTDRSYSICQIGGATSQVQVALMGTDGAEPATYIAQYNETRSMRTMNTDALDGQSASDLANITIMYNTRSGTTENRVRAWLIPITYNSLGVEGIKNAMKKEMAYMGFIFTDNIHDAKYVDIENYPEKYNLPIFDSNGVTTGRYIPFTDPDVENEDNYTWTTDVYERTPYNPATDGGDDGDPNTYRDGSSWATVSVNMAPTDERYLVSQPVLKQITDALVKVATDAAAASMDLDNSTNKTYVEQVYRAFGTLNPIELIDAVIAYPVDFSVPLELGNQYSQDIFGTATNQVYIGNSSLTIETYQPLHIDNETSFIFFTAFEYFDKYKSFLDYSPYCSSVLNLPWCGSINLDPEIYMGKRIQVRYSIDIDTGLCKATILSDGKIVDTICGQTGARIQFNTQDFNQQVNAAIQANQIQQQQRFNQVKSAASLLTAGLATVATGGAGAADLVGQTVGTAFNLAQSQMTIDQANYRVDTTAVPYKQICTGSDSISLVDTDGLHQVIYRPTFLPSYDTTKYGKQVGFATLEFGPLSNYHGYTEVETVNFDGVFATEKEQEMIKAALKSGVYLP